jgi:hypothetical protein
MNPNRPTPPDDFEEHLAQVPRRTAPAEWRAKILSAAKSTPRSALPAPRSPLPNRLLAWWGGLSPAWRTLATIWIVCLTINHFTGTAPAEPAAGGFAYARLAPEQIAAVRAQRREMLQLAGLTEPEPAEPPPPRLPRPRSSLPVPAYG